MSINNKIHASILFSSYFETLGFKNGEWEFNYNKKCTDLNSYGIISNLMLNHFYILGGPTCINLEKWYSSDDTILILATYKACLSGGGVNNYKNEYIKVFDLLKDGKRAPGIITLESIRLLKTGSKIEKKKNMGGTGAAMRTSPIGLFFYNDIEKVIKESIEASKLTHNYYIGFLGGMITALFTAYAINNISKFEWINKLLELYDTGILYKYHDSAEVDDFINYWKKYKEIRLNKFSLLQKSIINFNERINFLSSFFPNNDPNINIFSNMTNSGLDCCIYAYDCLLITSDLHSFMTLVCIHPGDNDTTGAIGGSWYGALNGFSNFNTERFKELEFYNEIKPLLNFEL